MPTGLSLTPDKVHLLNAASTLQTRVRFLYIASVRGAQHTICFQRSDWLAITRIRPICKIPAREDISELIAYNMIVWDTSELNLTLLEGQLLEESNTSNLNKIHAIPAEK